MATAAGITDQDDSASPDRRHQHIRADEPEAALGRGGRSDCRAQAGWQCRHRAGTVIGWRLDRLDGLVEEDARATGADLVSQYRRRRAHEDVAKAGRRQCFRIDQVAGDVRKSVPRMDDAGVRANRACSTVGADDHPAIQSLGLALMGDRYARQVAPRKIEADDAGAMPYGHVAEPRGGGQEAGADRAVLEPKTE